MAARADHPEYVCMDDNIPLENNRADPIYDNDSEEFEVNLTTQNNTVAVLRRTPHQKSETSANRPSRYDENLYALPDGSEGSEGSSPPESPVPACRRNRESPLPACRRNNETVSVPNRQRSSGRKNSWMTKYDKTCAPITCFFVVGIIIGVVGTYFYYSGESVPNANGRYNIVKQIFAAQV